MTKHHPLDGNAIAADEHYERAWDTPAEQVCDWCYEPADELRVYSHVWLGRTVDDHICAACFVRNDGEGSFADLKVAS